MSAPVPAIVDRSSLVRVVDALGDRVPSSQLGRDQVYARCPVPAHDDHQSSLSVTWRPDDKGGRTWVWCHRCEDTNAVLGALGLTVSDLFDTPPARPANADPDWKPARRRSTARRSTGAPAGLAAKPKTDKARQSGANSGHRPEPEEVYDYTTVDGVRAYDVIRFPGKDFRVRTYDTNGRRVVAWRAPAPERRVLFRLPRVLATVRTGDPVYLAEGEKDALALEAAGVVATCHAFGAADTPHRAKKVWLPQYAEALTGGHVVIVADRDPPGWRHALYVAGELEPVAAEVRVVEAVEGKDAADHLAAGRDVAELAPVSLEELRTRIGSLDDGGKVLQFPGTPADDADPGSRDGGGNDGTTPPTGGDDGDDAPRVRVRARYAMDDGGIWRVSWDRAKQFDVWREVLPVPVRLTARVALDLCDGRPPELTHVDLEATRTDPESGQTETVTLSEVSRRRWEACSWVAELPWPVRLEDDTHTGRSRVRSAITTLSPEVRLTTMYGALGWTRIDGTWRYVHAAGAHDPDTGELLPEVRVSVPEQLRPFTLPAPPREAEAIRTAVMASTALLDVVPARIAAPLLGAAYRACLGESRTTVMFAGTRGSGKTGLAAYAVQHYAPTARHNKMPGAGAGEDAATVVGLLELRHRAGHLLLPLEDLAPDHGPERANVRGAIIARSQYNRSGRTIGKRDPLRDEDRPLRAPRGLPLLSGEEPIRVESAESRIVTLPVRRGDLDPTELEILDAADEPIRRAELTAALVAHLRGPLDDLADRARPLASALRDPRADDPGLDARRAESVADLALGWQTMLEMARATGALTDMEAAELWLRAWAGLAECKADLMAGSAKRAAVDRVRDLLRAVLVRGDAVLRWRDGSKPANAGRCGWVRDDGGVGEWRANGPVVGWTDEEHVWLHPGAVLPILLRQGQAEGDPLTYTRHGLGEALADAGMVTTRTRKGGGRLTTVQRRLSGDREDVWELPARWLWPDPEDDAPEDGTPGDTGPSNPPPLATIPGTDTPPTPPTAPTTQTSSTPAAPAPKAAAEPEPTAPPTEAPAVVDDAAEGATAAAGGHGGPVFGHQERTENDHGGVAANRNGRPARSGRRPERAPIPTYAGPAVIVDHDTAWLARPGHDPARLPLPMPLSELSAAELLEWAAGLELGHADGRGKYRHSRRAWAVGQVWVTPPVRRALGWPAVMSEGREGRVLETLTGSGWSAPYGVRPWLTVRRDAVRLMVVVPEWLEVPDLLVGDAPDACSAAHRLARFAETTGIAYQWSPAITGVQYAAVTRPGLLQAEPQRQLPPPAHVGYAEGDYTWQRTPTPAERELPWVHLWDWHALYLGAAASLPLAWGPYDHVRNPEPDPDRPGYWAIDAPTWEHARLPDPIVGEDRAAGRPRVWVTTPTLKTLVELLEQDVRPHEAYLAAETIPDPFRPGKTIRGYGRLLDKWSAELGTGRLELLGAGDPDQAAVSGAVKAAYAHGVGRFGWRGGAEGTHPLWRPDFRHHVVAQGRYVITRRLLTVAEAGMYPLAIVTDGVVFASSSADPAEALPPGLTLGDRPGQLAHLGCAPMEAVAPMLQTGRAPAATKRGDDGEVIRYGLTDTIRRGGGTDAE